MRIFNILLISFFFSLSLYSQAPAIEVRAAWLTTNWGLDWPTVGASVDTQKKELQKILDDLQADNFNTILFQARAQGKAFYRSKIEPLSTYFNHSDNFDPLAFAIEECHKRGLECHAWITTYPMERVKSKTTGKGKRKVKTILEQKPDYYKALDDIWYLDPGRPETNKLLLSIVDEIVTNYDIDGIHFDYIRYPSNTQKFPDDDSYKKYANGKDKHDWRRENINNFVANVYDNVKSKKNWVQVSSSPLGRYKVLPEVFSNDGWTAYETVFQDAGFWMKNGKHDLVFPMMYYKGQYFYPFVEDWVKNSNGRPIVPGLGVYQMDEQGWSVDEITNQMKFLREKKVPGQAYFRTGNILNNLKGIQDSIHSYYPTPAKLPPFTWLSQDIPNVPTDIQIYRDKDMFINMSWESPDSNKEYTYNVYFCATEDVDKNNAYNLLATGLHSNNYSFFSNVGEFAYYYFVTASDRYHNESLVSYPAYFVHSEEDR